MKTLGNIFGALVALALTAALGYYGFIVAKKSVVLFARLDFPIAMVTATASTVVLLAALIIASSIRRAAEHNGQAGRRADKAEAYKLFIGLWEEMLQQGQTAENILQLSQRMPELNHLLILRGSATILRAHTAMQSASLQEARAQFADSLLTIRKELGVGSPRSDGTALAQLLPSESDGVQASRPGARQDAQPRVLLSRIP